VAATLERKDIRTPVTILTGFLGSGKTTLLNRVLHDPATTRTAVVINEFGQVSIDHSLTITSSDSIVVLENGCLCCTVFGDLLQTLNRLYHAREAGEIAFEQVVIETSGLAEPTPVLQAFLSDPTLAGLFRVCTVIATVDAVNGDSTLTAHDVSMRQVALADYVLITKLDLIKADNRRTVQAALTARLRRLNPTALIYAIDDPAADPVKLISRPTVDPARDPQAAKAWLDEAMTEHCPEHNHAEHAHHHDVTIAAFSLIRTTPVAREALQLLLDSIEKHLGPGLLRVKGLVNVADNPTQPAVIQGAQHLLHNLSWLSEWPDADRRTRIVFITQGIPSGDLEEMVNLLDRVALRTANARLRASAASAATRQIS
jgi:G3E family GTPase